MVYWVQLLHCSKGGYQTASSTSTSTRLLEFQQQYTVVNTGGQRYRGYWRQWLFEFHQLLSLRRIKGDLSVIGWYLHNKLSIFALTAITKAMTTTTMIAERATCHVEELILGEKKKTHKFWERFSKSFQRSVHKPRNTEAAPAYKSVGQVSRTRVICYDR